MTVECIWHLLWLDISYNLAIPGSGVGLGMRPTNERRPYIVTTSLIRWAHI